MSLHIEDEFALGQRRRGRLLLQRRLGRQLEIATGSPGSGMRGIDGQQARSRAAAGQQELATRHAQPLRMRGGGLPRQCAGLPAQRIKGDGFELTIAGGIELDRQVVAHASLFNACETGGQIP
jgi:hypothetical protein